MDKAKSQRIHAKRRALQRYDISLNREDLEKIIQLIQTGKGRCIEKQSNTRTIFIVEYKGKDCKVVYDKLRKNICTFLPMEDKKNGRD